VNINFFYTQAKQLQKHTELLETVHGKDAASHTHVLKLFKRWSKGWVAIGCQKSEIVNKVRELVARDH
jgi:hypothetical protein